MSLKPSIGQIVNPFFLQDGQDANPSAVSYPLNVADGVKGGSSAVDPLSLDIAGLPTGTLATTTELAINNGTVNEKTTLSDLATFLDGRDVYSVADITALNAITGMDTGDVAIVADTFDDTGENIAGSYIYNGTTWLLQSWYNVYLNTLLDVNAPSPATGDILQWDGTQWVNVANAFAPLNGTPTEVRYFDNAGVDHSDPLFTRDSVTNHTEATRDYNSTSSTINTATVPVSFLTANTNGTFNIGDQVETQFGEAQAEVLDVGTVSTYFVVYLTNITGTLPIGVNTRLNNLTTPFQTDDGNILAAQFTIGDTVDVIDLSAGFNQVGQIEITQTSGQDFNYTVNSGTIAIGNMLYGPSVNKVGFIYNLTSNIINKTINTGFRTEPIQFPNAPFIIEGSAIVATDGVDKMAVGVFDSVSGQSELSAGIVARYGDSSQSTFTLQNNDLFIEVYDGASDSYLQSASPTTFTLKNTISGIEHGISQSSGAVTLGNLSGGNNTKITVDDSAQTINFNGEYSFPFADGTSGQALVTDGSGTLSWAAAGGGGTPAGSDTQIQYNNAGAFGADADLTFDPATSTFKAVTDNPLFRSTIKFSSNGGTDDLTASLATAFTGTPPTTFVVFAYGNIQIVNYINLVGGNFSQGDTITGSVSGAEGYVAYDDGVGQFYVSITNSIQFAATDVIDNANGVTADYDTSTTSDDIFFWFSTNGGSGGPIVITGTAQTLNDGIDITFGSTTGHGAGDSWQWSYKTLKNTWLTNNQAESAVSGYVNGSVYDNGSNNIVAINGLVQNGGDDRIFPLSFYQDLSSGNRNQRERAYYGFNPFKGDPTEPLEFIVYMRKGVGIGPGPTDITEFKANTVEGFRMETNKSILMSSPLFSVSDQTFSWVGVTNSTGITIDDVNEQITISNLSAYDDDTAAGVGGLTAGMVYMTTGSGSAPLNAAGILMIKQ